MNQPHDLSKAQKDALLAITRRQLFQRTGTGVGALALGSLLGRDLSAAMTPSDNPAAPQAPHFAPRAKSVICMHMIGAPSHLDLLDYKPTLVKHDGEKCPKEFIEGKRFAFIRGHPSLMGTPYKFKRCGHSGIEISELLPHLQSIADDITVVKTLHTEEFNHGPAQLFFQTGFGRLGRPSVGAWVNYGLGSANEDLPGFVVLVTGVMGGAGSALWGSGFLPTVYQGVEFRGSGDPVLFLSNPPGVSDPQRGRIVDAINAMNRVQLTDVGDPEIATRISQYELAYRMQMSVPELTDISSEPKHILEMYGAQPGKATFANHCLMARRLVERGVRFVQLYNADWDHHNNLPNRLPPRCKDVDKPMAALVTDLKQRGLLDETLVTWGGEFGRTPMMQTTSGDGRKVPPGRDHHKEAFACWMAGGGLKPGTVYGETDELGYSVARNPMHINDLHATILHLLGMDHERLTFKYQGRPFRLTDVAGHVARDLLL